MDDRFLRACMAELIGTFAVVFISAGAVCVNQLDGRLQPASVSIALAAGFVYAVALAFTLPVAGGYLNPAVTIVLWVFRRLDGTKTSALLVSQLLGSALAGLCLFLLAYFQEGTAKITHLGAPQVNADAVGTGAYLPLLKALALELVMTFVFVIAVFGTVLDPRGTRWAGPWVERLACLWLGLLLAAETIVALPYTGGAVNPARWFGPAMWDRIQIDSALHYHAVYWVGPIAGALLAAWVYTALILPPEEEKRVTGQASAHAGNVPAGVGSSLFRAKK